MNTISRLIHLLNTSRPGESDHEIARVLLNNTAQLESMSIHDLADICFSSAATISRLAKKLGYSSYSDFHFNLLDALRHYPRINRRMPFVELSPKESAAEKYLELLHSNLDRLERSIRQKDISRVTDAIHNAKKVSFYSSLLHHHAAVHTIASFQLDLVMEGKETACFGCFSEQKEDAQTLTKDCAAVVIVPNTKDAADLVRLLEILRIQKAELLIISAGYMSSYKKYGGDVLSIDAVTGCEMDDDLLNVMLNILIVSYRNTYIDLKVE